MHVKGVGGWCSFLEVKLNREISDAGFQPHPALPAGERDATARGRHIVVSGRAPVDRRASVKTKRVQVRYSEGQNGACAFLGPNDLPWMSPNPQGKERGGEKKAKEKRSPGAGSAAVHEPSGRGLLHGEWGL